MFNEILKKHTKPCTCREIYNISSDLEITIDQKENKVVMWGFKSVASDLYSSGNYYYITIDTSKKESRADKSYEVEIEELNKKIDCLNDIIARLEARNNRLEQEVNKYKDFKRNLDDLKKGVLIHNARGAGRKAKFTDKQIEEIRRLREDGNTIKEIANRYNCSVGLIHKLINEN